MKFCKTCGEVYASSVTICAADDRPLCEWTYLSSTRGDPQIHSQTRILHSAMARRDDDATSISKFVPPRSKRDATPSPKGKKHAEPVDSDVGEHTSVMSMQADATLADFSVEIAGDTTPGELFCYDAEESVDPFQGMLISKRYRLAAQIGTGAFGVVFDAFDIEDRRQVAVKILSPALCNDTRALTRFRREAIAASRILHPGIVNIYDFGIQDEGVSYIVMEYLAGCDLAALVEREACVSQRRASEIICQCARALTAAHDAGVLHRDLKPANIFVVREQDMRESIKILDFGIAKDRSSNPRIADLTSASKVVGTPYYMSPEQAQGHKLDGRADIYSLGVILYELLTGMRPFEGNSVYEILLAHVHAQRKRPSQDRPDLQFDMALEDIVMRAVSASRDERFATMREFSSALERYIGDHSWAMTEPLRQSKIVKRTESKRFSDSNEITQRRVSKLSRRRALWWIAIPLTLAAIAVLASQVPEQDTSPSQQSVTPEIKIPANFLFMPPPVKTSAASSAVSADAGTVPDSQSR